MKRLVVLSMTIMVTSGVIMAQGPAIARAKVQVTQKEIKTERKALKKLDGNNVSELAKLNFSSDFGNVKGVMWRRNNFFDEASFTKNGKKMTAFYDATGKLVGTTSVASMKDLTPKAQEEISTRYKDYTVGPVIFFNDNNANDTDMYLYDTQFDDSDNYFVELSKGTNKLVLLVTPEGAVSFFKQIK